MNAVWAKGAHLAALTKLRCDWSGSDRRICALLGARGFPGRATIRSLAKSGHRVRDPLHRSACQIAGRASLDPLPTTVRSNFVESIAFINGSHRSEGIHVSNEQLFRAALDAGYNVRWYDCIDPHRRDRLGPQGTPIPGKAIPFVTLEMGLNRIWTFPRALRRLRSQRLYLGDPTFLNALTDDLGRRAVVHVHDLRPLSPFADRWATGALLRHTLPRLCVARRIRVPTRHLARELDERFGVSDKTVVLAPYSELPPDRGRMHRDASLRRREASEPLRVLYVAQDRPYKNIPFFLELASGFERIPESRVRFRLVSKLTARTADRLRRDHPSNLEHVDFVRDRQSIYEDSDVLLFPSLYEGFGLPLLEAMARGMPVVASDIPPLRELFESGGRLLPLNDTSLWSDEILRLADPTTYRAASDRALSGAAEFSYERFRAALPRLLD